MAESSNLAATREGRMGLEILQNPYPRELLNVSGGSLKTHHSQGCLYLTWQSAKVKQTFPWGCLSKTIIDNCCTSGLPAALHNSFKGKNNRLTKKLKKKSWEIRYSRRSFESFPISRGSWSAHAYKTSAPDQERPETVLSSHNWAWGSAEAKSKG